MRTTLAWTTALCLLFPLGACDVLPDDQGAGPAPDTGGADVTPGAGEDGDTAVAVDLLGAP